MAFRLRKDESVVRGLRRLASKELRAARRQLKSSPRNSEEAVHEARKSVKKVRAIVQLIDEDRGKVPRVEKRLRSVNRTLSALRDADVMLSTFRELSRKQRGAVRPGALATLRRRLSARKRDVMKNSERTGAFTDIRRQLRGLRRKAKRWRPNHSGFRALAPGILETHRRGREALARARKTERAEDFHEWRKQIKALWYELRLLEEAIPAVRGDITALHKAETWLGEEHNVVVLCQQLTAKGSPCHGLVDIDRLRVAADRQQCELRKKAVAGARRIYARRSGDYVRRIEEAWKSWRSRG